MADEDKGVVVKSEPRKTRSLGPFDEMERFFDNVFSRNWLSNRFNFPTLEGLESRFGRGGPKVDLIERDEEIELRAEIPGLTKDQVEVTVTDDSITLRGDYSHKKEKKEDEYYYKELSSGSFVRTLSLPSKVQSDKAKASLKDGLLQLTVPKQEKSQRKVINIE